MKKVVCAVIGRPSSGKSTFVNTICENKVSIVSSVPQSTLTNVNGCYVDKRGKIIFTDTPGLHIDERKFNTRLTKSAVNAIRNSDCVLYILDGGDNIGDEEMKTCFYASTSNKPVIVLINKNDIAKKEKIDEKIAFVKENIKGCSVLIGSALNDEGLDEVLIEIFKYGQECDAEYVESSEEWTDSSLDFRVAEEIREVVFNNTKDEIPHSVYVNIDDISEADEGKKVVISATIFTEKNSQKGILIGKGGSMIKKIRTLSQKSIAKIFPKRKVDLFLNIKVNPNWKNDKTILEKLGI